jgi:hypothetical protein
MDVLERCIAVRGFSTRLDEKASQGAGALETTSGHAHEPHDETRDPPSVTDRFLFQKSAPPVGRD